MDMKRIESLMHDLRLANECEAAAQMDVCDAEWAMEFAERKLIASKERLAEVELVSEAISNKLADAVNDMTTPPILMLTEIIDVS